MLMKKMSWMSLVEFPLNDCSYTHYKKVTRQQFCGMPTGSVIVLLNNLLSLGHLKARFHDTRLLADFGLSYPRRVVEDIVQKSLIISMTKMA